MTFLLQHSALHQHLEGVQFLGFEDINVEHHTSRVDNLADALAEKSSTSEQNIADGENEGDVPDSWEQRAKRAIKLIAKKTDFWWRQEKQLVVSYFKFHESHSFLFGLIWGGVLLV